MRTSDHWTIWAGIVDMLLERGIEVEAADVPGLWRVRGHPELTTSQLVGLAFGRGETR